MKVVKMLNNKILNNSEKIEKILLYIFLLAALFILIYNIFNYDPAQGYDADAHFLYVDILPRITNLLPENTYEYFNPPLPYIFPSIVGTICERVFLENFLTCRSLYINFIQVLQFFMFILSTYFYLKTLELLKPKDISLKLSFIILLFLLTANYKTFAMFRGETYIVLLNSYLLYRFATLVKNSFKWVPKDYIIFGLVIGLLALSRQWAFLLFPPYFLIYIFLRKDRKLKYLKFIISSFVLGFLVSSWWYFRLFIEFGSFTAFNMDNYGFNFSNYPFSFYFPFNTEALLVFTQPIRSNFKNQFLPILYSDLWGDYWGYFSFTSNSLDTGRNQLYIGDYLARVNIVSLFATFILLAGLKIGFQALFTKNKEDFEIFNSLVFLSVLSSFSGYLWFLIKYPSYNGNTIKAVYIIQLFHLMCLLGAFYMKKIKNSNQNIYYFFIVLLVLSFIHNFSSMLSHY